MNARKLQPRKTKKTHAEKKETRGHMALRNNVRQIRLALWKELRPLEMCVLDVIIDRTIGWKTKEAKIKMEDFEEISGQKSPHIYVALKALETKKMIFRTKIEHNVYYELNETYFGSLLIKKHEEAYQKRKSKFKLVVDNSEPKYENGTDSVPNPYNSGTESVQGQYETRTENVIQESEIIDETPDLKKVFKESIKESIQSAEENPKPAFKRLDFSKLGEGKKLRTSEEHHSMVMNQLAQMKAGQLLS